MPEGVRARALLIATYVVLFAVGVLSATIAAFLVPQRLAGGIEGLSILIALIGNLSVGLLGGLGTRTVAGAAVPAVGWFAALAAATFVARGGDVVIPGRLPVDPGVVKVGGAVWLVGLLASIVPIPLTNRYTARVNPPKGLS
ncbi:MAG TPA: hypothetical protein VHC43_09670 [Mycobacteriales bacterium]|nr:hypothetical protein [Mycobacteriales bacterium]